MLDFESPTPLRPDILTPISGGPGNTFGQKVRQFFLQPSHSHRAVVALVVIAGAFGVLSTMFALGNRTNLPLIYQGRLTDANFIPVTDASRNVRFKIFDALSGGSCVWSTGSSTGAANCATATGAGTVVATAVDGGLFTEPLGNGTTNNPEIQINFNSGSYYLEVIVDNENPVGTFETLAPRKQLGGTTFSYMSDLLDGLESTAFAILSGQSGGQTINGDTAASGNLTLSSTVNATKGKIFFGSNSVYDENNGGLLGIGTTVPAASIELVSSGATANSTIRSSRYADDGFSESVQIRKARGTSVSPVIVQSQDETGYMNFWGYDGSQFLRTAYMLSKVDGTPGLNDMPGRLDFFTTPDGSAAAVQRMRIDNAGNVGIGQLFGAPATARLHIQGGAAVVGTGTITSSGTAVTGSGTVFTTDLHVGDTITAQSQAKQITAIASNTSLTVSSAFSPDISSALAFTYTQSIARFADNSGAEQVRIGPSGGVLIGAPSIARGKLQISTSAGNSPIVWESTAAAADNKFWDVDYGAGTTWQLRAVNDAYTASQTALQVSRSGATVSSVSFPNGNVGIGTGTPLAPLHVFGTAGNFGIFQRDTNGSGANFVSLYNTNTTDTDAAFLNFETATTGTGATAEQGIARIGADFMVHDNATRSGDLSFNLFNNGTEAERMRIKGNGNVGVGTSIPSTRLEVVGDITSKGTAWTSRTSAADNQWRAITYGNGLFVAVSADGTGNRVMTSPDGVNWTLRTDSVDNNWNAITYGNGLFVAVANTGTGNRVMTSPDGVTWTTRTSAADNSWSGITYGNNLFVAVAITGTGNRVMTSPDGITWTTRTSAADNGWFSVVYANGFFVAVANTGTGNRVMTSPDGVTWTTRTSAADYGWRTVTYGNGLFVAVANTVGVGDRIMSSPDGVTWVLRASTADNDWRQVAYGNGVFAAVSFTGTGNRVMTSGKADYMPFSANNTYQGGLNIFGNVGIGTTSPGMALDVVGVARASAGITATGGALGPSANAQLFVDSSASINATAVLQAGTGTSTLRFFRSGIFDSSINVGTGSTDNMRFLTAATERLRIDSVGHVEYTGTAPAISACGTGPSGVGNDMAGKVTIGTAPGTSCTITFAGTWTNAPICMAIDETTATVMRPTTTATVLTVNGSFVAGDVVSYMCSGRR